MERALKKAIEGGYTPCQNAQFKLWSNNGQESYRAQIGDSVFLDPLFWQCLGKAEEWFYEDGRSVAKYINNDPKHTQYDMYLWHWHRFIDHLDQGGNVDEFFEKLLK